MKTKDDHNKPASPSPCPDEEGYEAGYPTGAHAQRFRFTAERSREINEGVEEDFQ